MAVSVDEARREATYDRLERGETKLQRLEQRISVNMRKTHNAMLHVGRALAEVRDGKHYRPEYATFEDYCDVRWSISRVQAHRLIRGAGVMSVLESHPLTERVQLPENEAQVRELAKLPEDRQPVVWREALRKAPRDRKGRRRMSARVVADVAAGRRVKKVIHRKFDRKYVVVVEEKPAPPRMVGPRDDPKRDLLDWVGKPEAETSSGWPEYVSAIMQLPSPPDGDPPAILLGEGLGVIAGRHMAALQRCVKP